MAASAAIPRVGSSAPRPKLAARSAAPPDAMPAPRHAPHAAARVATPPRRRSSASDSSSAFAAAYGSCPTEPTSAATDANSVTPRDGLSSPRDSAARFSAAIFGAATARTAPAVCRGTVASRSAPAAWNVAATFLPTRSRAKAASSDDATSARTTVTPKRASVASEENAKPEDFDTRPDRDANVDATERRAGSRIFPSPSSPTPPSHLAATSATPPVPPVMRAASPRRNGVGSSSEASPSTSRGAATSRERRVAPHAPPTAKPSPPSPSRSIEETSAPVHDALAGDSAAATVHAPHREPHRGASRRDAAGASEPDARGCASLVRSETDDDAAPTPNPRVCVACASAEVARTDENIREDDESADAAAEDSIRRRDKTAARAEARSPEARSASTATARGGATSHATRYNGGETRGSIVPAVAVAVAVDAGARRTRLARISRTVAFDVSSAPRNAWLEICDAPAFVDAATDALARSDDEPADRVGAAYAANPEGIINVGARASKPDPTPVGT